MTYSPGLASAFNDTKMRSPIHSPQSGMCSFCTADCIGPCELGLSAVLGAQAVYPTNTGNNQVAGEKEYPYDYSHFNIAGRVFGAMGAPADMDRTGIFSVGLERTIGHRHPIKLALPITLPALVKLRYLDYFAGAAMAGVTCVIGEGSPSKDPKATFEMERSPLSLTSVRSSTASANMTAAMVKSSSSATAKTICRDSPNMPSNIRVPKRSNLSLGSRPNGHPEPGFQKSLPFKGYDGGTEKTSVAGCVVIPIPAHPDSS